MHSTARTSNSWLRPLAGPAVALAVLVLGTGPAAAETGTCTKKKEAAKAAATAAVPAESVTTPEATPADVAGEAGMKAYIDPATGKLRQPTAADLKAAAAAKGKQREALQAAPAPKVVQHANGMLSAQLGEEYMEDVAVRKNADGTLSFQCAPHSQMKKAAEKQTEKPTPSAKPELEKE
jgi:hypothetical protein